MTGTWYAEMLIWPAPDPDEDPELCTALNEAGVEFGYADAATFGLDDLDFDFDAESGRGREWLHVVNAYAPNGCTFFMQSGLPELCRARELCFLVRETGCSDHLCEEYSWRPGLDEPIYRIVSSDYFPLLDEHLIQAFAAGSVDEVELMQRIRAYFAYRPLDYWPETTPGVRAELRAAPDT